MKKFTFQKIKKKIAAHFKALAKTDKQAGATFVEVLVTIAIIVILMGAISIGIISNLDKAKNAKARQDIGSLKTTVTMYILDNRGEKPQALADIESLLPDKKVPNDPWGNEYNYDPTGHGIREFDIWSSGPNGDNDDGEEDDIPSWNL